MKKILGIFAASAAALGSAMIAAAPVNAQSAVLPVEVEVTPAIFLRTYQNLKFVVSQQDLQRGTSVQQSGSYNEKSGIDPLSTAFPSGQATDTVKKVIPRLYQVWGANTGTNVEVSASKATLTSGTGGGGFGGGAPETVTMTVTPGALVDARNPAGASYKEAPATLDFKFTNPNAASGTTYTGGEITIRVTNP